MKTRTLGTYFILLLGLILTIPSYSQITLPALSPEGFVRQKVGYTTVEVNYCRPSMRGRLIFGEVVPFGEVWRTGANASTKISFSEEVTLEGHKVPAGKYALYTIPGEKEWTVILSKNTRLWGAYGYSEADDLLRFKVNPVKSTYHFETFTIDVGELTQTSATLQLMWENTIARINLGTSADEQIVAELDKRLSNPMVEVGNNYYAGADYYLRTHRDMDQALDWINKAVELNGETPWYMQTKAEIMYEKGEYNEAIRIASNARDKAKTDGDEAYVTSLDKMIEKWKNARSKN